MSFGTAIRSAMKTAKTRFPGAADADLQKFVHLQVGVAMTHTSRGVKDDDLFKVADAAFEAAVQNGESWAVSLHNSYRDSVIKPLVVKAREKGVDPIPAIVMQTDLTEAQAAEMVAALDAVEPEDEQASAEDELAEIENDDDFSAAYGSAATTAA